MHIRQDRNNKKVSEKHILHYISDLQGELNEETYSFFFNFFTNINKELFYIVLKAVVCRA